MKKIKIKLNNSSFEANYTKDIFELMDGLFKDATKPLLMEFNFILRPVPIDTNSRRSRKIFRGGNPIQIFHLPIIDILTFNPQFKRVRVIKDVQNDVILPMKISEKYVLEVPKNLTLPFDSIQELKELKFERI